jgi:predicted metal-binding protein
MTYKSARMKQYYITKHENIIYVHQHWNTATALEIETVRCITKVRYTLAQAINETYGSAGDK